VTKSGKQTSAIRIKPKKRSPDWSACIPAHPPGEGQWGQPVSDAGNAHARAWAAGRTGPPTASRLSRPGSAGLATIVLRDGEMRERDGRQAAPHHRKLWPGGAKIVAITVGE